MQVFFDNMSINIESLIYTIRGQKVMVDFDLAMLYGVQTKALNQAVKRNIKRFPDDFMFQLTKEELDSLRSQIATANPAGHHNIEEWRSQFVTSNFARMGLRRPPYAFTRNGIGMLSSVLRIHSRYYESFQTDLKKHNEQYREIHFLQLPHKNHDRFLIIDDDVYLLGASVKDMGIGLCAITKMMTTPETILDLLK
jgi:hypothetical protein